MRHSIGLKSFYVISGLFILYIILSFSSWDEPIMGDEVTYALSIKGIADKSIMRYFIDNMESRFGIWHPPAYAHVVAFLGNFFGLNELTARSVGIASFFISIAMIYLIARELFKDSDKRDAAASIACLIYAINPLAIRGSLLIDMDGTILNACLLIFIYSLVGFGETGGKGPKIFLRGILFAVLLWIKFMTPLIFIATLFFYFLLRKDRARALYVLKAAAIGIFLFFGTWLWYCHANNRAVVDVLFVPLGAVTTFFGRNSSVKNWALSGRTVWALLLWCSPSFLLLAGLSLWRTFKKKAPEGALVSLNQLGFYGLSILIICIFVGGVTHSFPKYHYAIVPIFSLLISDLAVRNLSLDKIFVRKVMIPLIFLILYNIYFVKDPLYTINYALKEEIILRNGVSSYALITKEAFQILFLLSTILLAYIFFLRSRAQKPFIRALFITMLASNISLSLVQAAADYNTVYCYGAEGVREAAAFVRLKTDISAPAFSPGEILWLANENLSSYILSGHLNDEGDFLKTVKDHNIECVVYGISGNTVNEYRNIFLKMDVQKYLKERYDSYDIGSYTVWLKR
ncbi:MAG: hypothetical protein A2987_05845 [Omnitrophica bacterium RIFCSPLOWO2_01_FULL_45_10]|nr:MAG: hypothetical protein A2987_05845 [Omnitrophica bacterium RIFCSPLOWO2_01_FULL_45_10]